MGMLPLKVILLSTGVVSMAVTLKLSLPVIVDFLTTSLPLFWSLALSWLQPPYLYLLINCIIISIVATSKLQPRGTDEPPQTLTPLPPPPPPSPSPPEKTPDAVARKAEETVVVFGYVEEEEEVVRGHHIVTPVKEERENDDEFELSKVTWQSPEIECSPMRYDEKPPVSARFGHRRGVKASPEGKSKLRVTKPKKQETLESTWRTITEGRSIPLTRHLRKSDTYGGAPPDTSPSPMKVMKKSDTYSGVPPDTSPSPVKVMKMSDTFAGGNSSPASSGRLRREPSLSQDELNRRVEAFIKRFNEEMRLQRQESLSQYNEMVVGRGSR